TLTTLTLDYFKLPNDGVCFKRKTFHYDIGRRVPRKNNLHTKSNATSFWNLFLLKVKLIKFSIDDDQCYQHLDNLWEEDGLLTSSARTSHIQHYLFMLCGIMHCVNELKKLEQIRILLLTNARVIEFPGQYPCTGPSFFVEEGLISLRRSPRRRTYSEGQFREDRCLFPKWEKL
ncbi:hypothetical protein Bhyg_16922, partial [Pseudolycoriella hygida]